MVRSHSSMPANILIQDDGHGEEEVEKIMMN